MKNKRAAPDGLPFLLGASLELLRQRPQHDLVDTHIGRLFNRECDGAGDGVGGDGLFVERIQALRLVSSPEPSFSSLSITRAVSISLQTQHRLPVILLA